MIYYLSEPDYSLHFQSGGGTTWEGEHGRDSMGGNVKECDKKLFTNNRILPILNIMCYLDNFNLPH